MEGYHEAGWHCVGVEPNATMAADGQSRGIDVRHAMFEHFTMSTDEPLFDAVAMVQVLPHFMEPAAALDVARAVTRPGGLWLIETWNRRSVVARLRGEHWHEYSPPSVLHWFTHQSLDASVGYGSNAAGRESGSRPAMPNRCCVSAAGTALSTGRCTGSCV